MRCCVERNVYSRAVLFFCLMILIAMQIDTLYCMLCVGLPIPQKLCGNAFRRNSTSLRRRRVDCFVLRFFCAI